MAKLTRINNRSGWYLRVAVPADLRSIKGTRAVVKKAGDTHAEALKNRALLQLEIEQGFERLRGQDPVGDTFSTFQVTDEGFIDELTRNLRAAGLTHDEIDVVIHTRAAVEAQTRQTPSTSTSNTNAAPLTPSAVLTKAEHAIAAEGTSTWMVWLASRIKAESPAPTTERGWKSSLKSFAKWYGSEYLAVCTKEDATNYKDVLLDRIKHSSVRCELTRLKAQWTYAQDHGFIKGDNIWNGLTKKLKASKKKSRVSESLIDEARLLADKTNDIGFYLQLYTGCRRGDHQGLRWSDIDIDNNQIVFEEYQIEQCKEYPIGIKRRLKGGEKDERAIPLHSILKKKLIEFLPDIKCRNEQVPIFANEYRRSDELFGNAWSTRFTRSYGFTSHELRAHVVSQLLASNVSPYILFEITRHSVPGMSSVVQGYTRPTMKELQAIIEKLK